MFIDPFDRAWLSHLDGVVATDNTRMHLLLDGAFVPGLHRKVARCLPHGEAVSLLFKAFPGFNDEACDASPFMFRYFPHNAELQRVLAKCDGLPMVHAISSEEDTASLAARLAEWCAVEADRQRFNLRFPDTRRLPAIFAALDHEQQSALIGLITQWLYIARHGSWAELDLSSVERGIKPQPELFETGVLLLAPAQFAAMVDDGDADSALLLLGDRGLTWPLPRSEIYARAEGALKIAKQVALEEEHMLDWCEACLADETLLNACINRKPSNTGVSGAVRPCKLGTK